MNRDLVPHFTQTPDVCFDFWMPLLTGAEWKIVSYVIRKSYGWGKALDAISLRQFYEGTTRSDGSPVDRGTGVSRRGLLNCLDTLVEAGVLVKIKRSDGRGGDLPSLFQLNLDWEWQKHAERLKSRPLREPEDEGAEASDPGGTHLPPGGHSSPPGPVARGGAVTTPPGGHSSPPQETALQQTRVQQTAAARDMVHESEGKLGCPGNVAVAAPDEKAAAGFPPGWEMTRQPVLGARCSVKGSGEGGEKAALKAAAAAPDIKSAPDLGLAMEAGETGEGSAYEAEQSLIALGMAPEVAGSLLKRFEPQAVLHWIVRAEGKSNPCGFIRRMLESGAPRAAAPQQEARSTKHEAGQRRDADREAQALYEKTKAESRARKEGRPTTEEEFAGAMSSLAACLPGAREEMARRGLLR